MIGTMSSSDVVAAHRAAGRRFTAGGTGSFVLDQGTGPAVLLVHGVPASSFLYRKVLPGLAARGLRGVAPDLPGLGLADRRPDQDQTWSGLGRWLVEAVDALGLERFHLVVHDLGGPVGFELAAAVPDRVASLTVLDTIVDADGFKRPWTMQPFAVPVLGELWLKAMRKPLFRRLMALQGLADPRAVPREELDAWVDLLKRVDGGKAFLRTMRGFERTPEKQALYRSVVGDARRPVQVVWGERDPALRLDRQGVQAARAAGIDEQEIVRLPGKHFLQEDCAAALADVIADFVLRAEAGA